MESPEARIRMPQVRQASEGLHRLRLGTAERGQGPKRAEGQGGGSASPPGKAANLKGPGANPNEGKKIATPGNPARRGSGTAGKAGVFQVAGANAGFFGFQQGAANTSANVQLPANLALYQAPTSVTSHTVTIPGANPTNSNSGWFCSNATPAVCIWSKL